MKKLLLLLLFVPFIFSCADENEKVNELEEGIEDLHDKIDELDKKDDNQNLYELDNLELDDLEEEEIEITRQAPDIPEEFELKDFQGLFIEEVSNELEQLGLKYQIIDSVFTAAVPKGAIYIQDPIAGTFVKEGRTLYFTVRRIGSEKIRIPKEVFDGKGKTYMKNYFGSNFKLVFIPENGSVNLVVKSLRSGGRNLIGGDMLIKGSLINVYLELDIDKGKEQSKKKPVPQKKKPECTKHDKVDVQTLEDDKTTKNDIEAALKKLGNCRQCIKKKVVLKALMRELKK